MGKKRADSSTKEDAPRTAEVHCPCYAGWDVFEKNVRVVLRQQRAGTRAERAWALHVFDDAMRIQSQLDLQYVLEPGEYKLDEKPACDRRSMEERIEARRDKLIRRRKHPRA